MRQACFFTVLPLHFVIAANMACASPVADADANGDINRVRVLLEEGHDIHDPQPDGMTALHWAAYQDQVELTRLLIDRGANVEAANHYGIVPLMLAAQNGNAQIVRLLLAAGANPNATRAGGETALMVAARTGRVEAARALIDGGADVDAKQREGQTAAMWAAAEGHAEALAKLIDAGADYTTPLPSGFTPAHFAARQGKTQVVRLLLERGIDPNLGAEPKKPRKRGLKAGSSLLMLAAENGHFELAAVLLEAGANPNDNRLGYTPLHALAWVRKSVRGDGAPPPTGSGSISSLAFARMLVEHGAQVDARHAKRKATGGRLNRTDATPLLLAAETGDLPFMKLLVELGADLAQTNADQTTPLLAAAGVGVLGNGDESAGTEDEAIATIEYLLAHGANINAVDKNGNSAMHGAAYKSWGKLVQFLAEKGAEVDVWNRKNSRGWTPRKIAQGHRPGNFRPSPETEQAIVLAESPSGQGG